MGREIRRVPPNWEHPKKKTFDWRTSREVENYQPLYDEPFGPKMREWIKEWEAWEAGTHEDFAEQGKKYPNYWDWSDGPPDPHYYRPDWKEGEATWFQVYETVSEGTPVTPAFATKAELVDYLVRNGDFWDQSRAKEGRLQGPPGWAREAAERFVNSEWAPSMIVTTTATGVDIKTARDGI